MFQKILLSKKVRDERCGYHDFLSELFRLTLPKCFVEETFCVSEKSNSIFLQKKRISQFLIENSLSHSTDDLLSGTPLRFRKFWI